MQDKEIELETEFIFKIESEYNVVSLHTTMTTSNLDMILFLLDRSANNLNSFVLERNGRRINGYYLQNLMKNKDRNSLEIALCEFFS